MNAVIIINIFTSVVAIVMGVLIVTGIILNNLDLSSRAIFGIIFFGYGVYRLLNVQTKVKMTRLEKKIERLKKAQDKVIHNNKENK
jgi:hypothetical protein